MTSQPFLPQSINDAPGHSPERLPPLAGNVVHFPARGIYQSPRRSYQAFLLIEAIDLLRQSEAVCCQAKQLRLRAEAILRGLRCP